MKEKNKGDKDKIEDKYFKQIIPGLNRLLKVLGIPGEIVEILPTEYQNYRNETKRMDMCLKLESKETLNLEFKSSYVKKDDIINSLDYATYLRINYDERTNSYFISTKHMKDNEYENEWHNDNKYIIQLKTFKELDAEEHLENLRRMIKNDEIDDETDEVNDLLLIPFMKSEKLPKELIVECIIIANQIKTVNKDKLNEIKNLLLLLATKYTDTNEEFDEIERMVKMDGGIIENTLNHLIRIGKEEGIKIMAKELKKRGMDQEKIDEAAAKARNAKQ